MDLDETTRLFKIRKTILQMLQDRGSLKLHLSIKINKPLVILFVGFIVPPNQIKETLESFRENFQDRKGLITQVIHTDGVKKMMVYYEEEEKIKLKNLEDFLRLMLAHEIFDGILVYRKEITSSAKKVLMKFNIICFGNIFFVVLAC